MLRNPAVVSASVGRDWADAWREAVGDVAEMEVALRLMDSCARFLETQDPSVLLELPVEQRSLLQPEVEYYLRASGKRHDEIDIEVRALLESRRHRAKRPEAWSARTARIAHLPVDAERIGALMASYDTGERTMPMRPLLREQWSIVPPEAAAASIRLLSESGPEAHVVVASPDVSLERLDRRPLTFATGFLYQAHVRLGDRPGAVDFWSDGTTTMLLDGRSAPMLTLVERDVFNCRGRHELAYLAFFCSALRAEDGRFEFVDPADETVIAAIRARVPQFSPMTPAAATHSGKPGYVAHVIHGDDVFRAVFLVNAGGAGMIEMAEDEAVVRDVGLPRESFEGPVRLRSEEPPDDARDAAGADSESREYRNGRAFGGPGSPDGAR
jgi:hypothetical protein